MAVGSGYGQLYEFNLEQFCHTYSLPPVPTRSALHLLTRAGYLEYIEETTSSSRLMVTMRKDELYDLDLPPEAEDVFQCVLRTRGVLLLILFMLEMWLRFLSPYVEDASQVGYVESIERRGTLFKTYEGVLLPYKEQIDTTRVYRRDFIFTAADEQTAVKLKKAMFDARPVRVEYKQYHAILPWRGASKTIVTAVDSVDPSKILPPEFMPGGKR